MDSSVKKEENSKYKLKDLKRNLKEAYQLESHLMIKEIIFDLS
jgi:hypothetical protein